MKDPRILVMGCGGIGGIIAARLIEAGRDITIVSRNPSIAAAVNARGLIINDERGQRRIAAHAEVTVPLGVPGFDFIFLATQPSQVEDAARSGSPALAPAGALVCLQNGLCEQRIAAIAGAEHTLGSIVVWGGTMLEPGAYERTSEGGFVIGRLDTATDPRLDTLRDLLAVLGPVDITRNLRGARWSKLAINCAISSLGTIGGDRLGVLLRYRFVRRLALEVLTEVVAVARARRVPLEKVSGTIDLDWVALTENERALSGSPTLMAKHALLLAVGAKYRRLRSSMLVAIERGREPAVDFLNGEVVWRGREMGIPVPLNARIVDVVHAIAGRKVTPGVELLRALYKESRSDSAPPPSAHLADDATWAAPPA